MNLDEIVYKCPKCSRRLASPPRCAGKLGTCPRCDSPVMVPVRSESYPFLCPCGKTLFVKRGLVDKTVRCRFCSRVIRVPESKPRSGTSGSPAALPAAIQVRKPPHGSRAAAAPSGPVSIEDLLTLNGLATLDVDDEDDEK